MIKESMNADFYTGLKAFDAYIEKIQDDDDKRN